MLQLIMHSGRIHVQQCQLSHLLDAQWRATFVQGCFPSGLWRHVPEANCENSYQSFWVIIKGKDTRALCVTILLHSLWNQSNHYTAQVWINSARQVWFLSSLHFLSLPKLGISSLGYLYWFHGVWLGCTCSQGKAALLFINLFTRFSVPVCPVLLLGWN